MIDINRRVDRIYNFLITGKYRKEYMCKVFIKKLIFH